MTGALRRPIVRCVLAAACVGMAAGAGAGQEADPDQSIATHLADMLRAGRTVVSAHQATINDPDLAEKGFTGDELVRQAAEIFAEQNGTDPEAMELSERDRRLLDALTQAMHSVVEDHQPDINRPGVGFKGFIPAIFARLANEEFAALVGTEARMRVTAPLELVRNRKAVPDDWEQDVIATRFTRGDWPEGEPHAEIVEVEGRPAFRVALPEYYRESCLECHGTPKGEVDITGYPKEGGEAGDLGGVISITIFK